MFANEKKSMDFFWRIFALLLSDAKLVGNVLCECCMKPQQKGFSSLLGNSLNFISILGTVAKAN